MQMLHTVVARPFSHVSKPEPFDLSECSAHEFPFIHPLFECAKAWICYAFAQGKCALGAECTNLHVVPTEAFARALPTGRDCFGRERHATDREDMGGVGSFEKDPETQCTLYARPPIRRTRHHFQSLTLISLVRGMQSTCCSNDCEVRPKVDLNDVIWALIATQRLLTSHTCMLVPSSNVMMSSTSRYVGGLPNRPTVAETVRAQFSEWGELVRVHVNKDGGAAFVQFVFFPRCLAPRIHVTCVPEFAVDHGYFFACVLTSAASVELLDQCVLRNSDRIFSI